jgi:hypothetical protein
VPAALLDDRRPSSVAALRRTSRTTNLGQMTIWLSTEILNWDLYLEDSEGSEDDSWKRAYDHWKHAGRVLLEQQDPLYRVDVITTLKRALNHRLQYLNNLYQFKKIPTRNKAHGLLEQLADIGVIKPIMLKRLMSIRNEIEHQDAPPPTIERCEEFLEFTWYFLRSTDTVASMIVRHFTFEPEHDGEVRPYWITIQTGPFDHWIINLYGWVVPSTISEVPRHNWLKINVEATYTRAEYLAKFPETEPSSWGNGKEPDDIWFSGVLVEPYEYCDHIYKLYFTVQ